MTRYTVIFHGVRACRAEIALFTPAALLLFAVPEPLAELSPEMPMNAVVVPLSPAVSPEAVTELPFRACLSHEMPMDAVAAPLSLSDIVSELILLAVIKLLA